MKLQNIVCAAAAMICLAGCQSKPAAGEAFPTVGAAEFREMLEKGGSEQVLLDVRTPEEFSQGHIKGALNIDFYAPEFKAQLVALDKTKPYLIYCRSGNRTTQTIAMMSEMGFKKVVSLKKGLHDWSANNFPLEK